MKNNIKITVHTEPGADKILSLVKITDLELQVLKNIATSDYTNVATIDDLIDYPTWSFCATNDGNKSLIGALGSLVKKGLCVVAPAPYKQTDETVTMTAAGVQALKESGFTL